MSWEVAAICASFYLGLLIFQLIDFWFRERPSLEDLLIELPHSAALSFYEFLRLPWRILSEVLEGLASLKILAPLMPKLKQISRPARRSDWFKTFTYFIPKLIREPWVGDIHETREEMASEGYSRVMIEWATIVQLVLLILHWGINKALDILRPFKKPSAD